MKVQSSTFGMVSGVKLDLVDDNLKQFPVSNFQNNWEKLKTNYDVNTYMSQIIIYP